MSGFIIGSSCAGTGAAIRPAQGHQGGWFRGGQPPGPNLQPPRTGDSNLSQQPCSHLGQEQPAHGPRGAAGRRSHPHWQQSGCAVYLRGKPSAPWPLIPHITPLLSPLPSLSAAGWAQGAAFCPGESPCPATHGETACETGGRIPRAEVNFSFKEYPFREAVSCFSNWHF